MLLGKRQRPPMRRTTSMSEFGMDVSVDVSVPEESKERQEDSRKNHGQDGGGYGFPAKVSPRNSRRNFGEGVKPAHFLQACNLCNRRLGPGKDIYMYRGDSAFCSHECRQQQMNLDERKQKCSLSSMKKEAPTSKGAETSSTGETVAAA